MCDTLVSVTDDGVLFAKNSDRDPNESQALRWYPGATHDPGAEVACTWVTVPQVSRTHGVALSQPWWMWGAEMGANDHGVVIGNEAVFTRGPAGETALLGMDLVRLGLERSTTAAEAVEVMVTLLERHGQGGPCSHERPGFSYDNSFLVADPTGATVLETAGARWATEEVTGKGRSISNGLTIAGFADAHADRLRGRLANAAARRRRTEAAAEVARSPADLFAALRDHGDSPAPRWSPLSGALAAPCAHAGGRLTSTQTTASWVADLRAEPRHWVAPTAAPCTSTFLPVTVKDPAALGPEATNRFDPATRWWRHELLHRLVLRDHSASVARFAAARDRTERAWLDAPPSTTEAAAAVDEAEAAWLADLSAARLPDRRPRWLRRLWEDLDRKAAIAVVPDRTARAGAGLAETAPVPATTGP
ncbi:dipeptidase [soil metagenome]